MKDFGLVSIITPTWNCGPYIRETIDSILAQTYNNWELIVVDDCSTDDTREIMAGLCAMDSRIRYHINDKNSGAAMTRNHGLRIAQGRWVAFLDSDDLWKPEKLEKQLEFMVENGYHFSYTGYNEMDENGALNGVSVSGPRHISKRGMFRYCWPGCLTVMYDASVVGLLQIADIRKNNDYAMWLQVIRKADCYLLPEMLATYRRGRSGSVSTQGILTMIKWHYLLFRDAEGKGPVSAFYHTCVNIFFGFYKKLRYVSK